MGFLVAWAWRNGLRKGVFGGSPLWLAVAVASGAVRVVKRMNERNERDRLGMTLEPGERIELSVVEPAGRKGRRRPE
ncbi:MAG TPA: hypothetical protein VNB24_05330 [Acidimicrobiales bacterium]|nr:hypothetical protein [Acidimicrobiales bacterium]